MYSKVMAAKQAAKSKTFSNIAWGREEKRFNKNIPRRKYRNTNSLLAYIGLGSNLKDPKAQIKRALDSLNDNNETELINFIKLL